ncbi:hypothetical protein M5689_006907 [Euphorbia peplus]|nr:hypothetical protein M5689_006907 [Euphorbia peplus]
MDISATSSLSQADSKKKACYAALQALQRLLGLTIVDFNYPRLQSAEAEYLSDLDAFKENVLVPYSKLLAAHAALKTKIKSAAEIVVRLQPILDRINRLFN